MAEQPSRSASRTEAVTAWSLLVDSELAELTLRMVGMAPAVGAGLERAQTAGICVQPASIASWCSDSGVIGVGVGRERPGRARSPGRPAGMTILPSRQATVRQDAGEVRLGSGLSLS